MKRKIITTIFCGGLAIGLAVGCVTGRKTGSRHIREDTSMFANNRYLSKGGLGMINTNIYIVVNSAKSDSNELVVCPTHETEQRWKGRRVTKAEIVVFYEGKVWPEGSLPDEFDLSKAVLVSFETEKVRFFDFQTMSGGYYERISASGSQ